MGFVKTISEKDKPAFCKRVSSYLTDFLGTPVTFNQVLDELFLYEMGAVGDAVLQQYIKWMIEYALESGAKLVGTTAKEWILKKMADQGVTDSKLIP